MQKKLLAAAVLSALSGAAAAQSANVTIYGTLYSQFEWGSATGGDTTSLAAAGTGVAPVRSGYTTVPADPLSRIRTDGAGANFGLRGTEDLGNGLQAWFQVEVGTAGAIGGTNPASATSLTGYQGLTYRNSAIGLRGNAWGSFLIGIWDTPSTVAFGQTALVPKLLSLNSANASAGFYGTTPMAAGGTFSGTSMVQACTTQAGVAVAAGGLGFAPGTGATCLTATQNMDRRQGSILQYWTPNWNGFEGRLAYSPSQENWAANNANQGGAAPAATTATNTLKPSIWGGSLNYGIGGFLGSFAYQRHNDLTAAGVRQIGAGQAGGAGVIGSGIALNGAAGTQSVVFAGNMTGSTEQLYRLGAKYKFDSGFGIGGRFEWYKANYSYASGPAAGTANLDGFRKRTFGIAGSYEAGPHAVTLEFNKIPNVTFNGTNGAGAIQGFSSANSGSRQWFLGYDYALSKRTDLQAYYVQVTNDTNARYSGAVFNALQPTAGGDPRYFGVGLRHTF